MNNLHKIIKHKNLDYGEHSWRPRIVISRALIKLYLASRSRRKNEKYFHDSMSLIVYFMRHF